MHDTAGRTSIRSQTRAEEPLLVAILLSLAGGYLDAFTWIAHDGVMANAQTANVVLFGVYGATGEWTEALRYLPPIAAFMLGVLAVCWVRSAPVARNGRALARFDAPRQALVLFLVCVTFAAGAGLGALVTTGAGGRALIVPILLLLAALILCHRGVPVARSATLSER